MRRAVGGAVMFVVSNTYLGTAATLPPIVFKRFLLPT